MEQFIRYLYGYEQGKRAQNVGFTKIRKYPEFCSVQIYGRGLDFGNSRQMKVYLFYEEKDRCVGLLQGVLEGAAPVVNYLLKFNPEDTEGEETYRKINGVVLENCEGKRYAAVWNETDVDIEGMNRGKLTAESNDNVENSPEKEERVTESLLEHVERLVEEEQAKLEREEIEDYQLPKERTYEKITRQDLVRLPKRDWDLANNHFLLHGYYNYHHLMLIREKEQYWLGIPGIYHDKERMVASRFGFPQFRRLEDSNISLSEEEQNRYEDFGYWCRQVEVQSL